MTIGFGLGVQRLGSFGVATLTALNAFTPGANLRPTGFVYADPTPANNGVYTWSGSAWVRQRGLADGIAKFTSLGGTANAITATFQTGIDPATVVAGVLVPAVNNTGAVTLNGDAILDRSGGPLGADALVAGVAALLLRDGSSWRLLTGMVAEISDVAGLSDAISDLFSAVASKADISALAGKASLVHTHVIADVTGLQAALDAKTTVPAQINAATDTAFADADMLVARKAADGSLIKRSVANFKALLWTAWGALINAGTAKTTPVDADALALMDSAASNATKSLSLTNLWSNYLKAKADALYQPVKTILTTLGNLANGAGYLSNNGSGVLSWGTPSGGWDMTGQSWQSVTRAANTSYQNTTGKPIAISTTYPANSNSQFITISVSTDNSTWVQVANDGVSTASYTTYLFVFAVIPPGHYYKIAHPGATTKELR